MRDFRIVTSCRVAVYYARAYAKARKNTVQVLRKRIEVMAMKLYDRVFLERI